MHRTRIKYPAKLHLSLWTLPRKLRPHAKKLLNQSDWKLQIIPTQAKLDAVTKLGESNNIKTIPFLGYALRNEENWKIRRHSISALRKIGHENIIPELGRALEIEEDESIRRHCVIALKKVGHESVVPILKRVIQHDEDFLVSQTAIKALETILHEKAIQTLQKTIEEDERFSVRRYAMETIENIGHPDGIPALLIGLVKPDEIGDRNVATVMLEKMGAKLPATHLLNKALALVNPREKPSAFKKIYEYIKQTKGRKSVDHYHTYAKQLKAREPDLKQGEAVA